MADARAGKEVVGARGRTALEASDLRDRIHEGQRRLDTRLWTRLLPGVAATAWALGLIVAGVNVVPAAILGAGVGFFSWREYRWRGRTRAWIRDFRAELERLETGESPPSPPARSR